MVTRPLLRPVMSASAPAPTDDATRVIDPLSFGPNARTVAVDR